MPTVCVLAGIPLPDGVQIDGHDISSVLTAGAPSPHDEILLFDNEEIVGIRTQRWKYVTEAYYRRMRSTSKTEATSNCSICNATSPRATAWP